MSKDGTRKRLGRPPGSHTNRATLLTRKQAAAIIESGLSPLDVMMSTLRFWDREVRVLEEGIRANLPKGESLLRIERTDVVDRYFKGRDSLLGAAVVAAPYVHPRISPIIPGEGNVGGIQDLSELTDAELDALERISRKIARSYGNPAGEVKAKG